MKNRNENHDMCRRCGQCCIKGGPAFHLKDRNLIEKGIIPAAHLFTIRKKEPVMDNVRGHLIQAGTDIIKIKGSQSSWACIYFDQSKRACTIYFNRPQECRLLKCWDTHPVEQSYAKDRLTRKALLQSSNATWQLVETHQRKCDYEMLVPLMKTYLLNPDQPMDRRLAESITYDRHIRELMIQKGKMDKGILAFIFGRPVEEHLKGLKKYLVNLRGLRESD